MRTLKNVTVLAITLGFSLASAGEVELVTDLEIGRAADGEGYTDVMISLATAACEDANGNIYVVDVDAPAVYKISSDGETSEAFGQSGEGPGDLSPMPVIDCDGEHLFVTGIGGRVDILDLDWKYLRSFDRVNPGSVPRCIRVKEGGAVLISAVDLLNQTALDLYDEDGGHELSFVETFGVGRDVDWRLESHFGGGFADFHDDGTIYYAQVAPFEIRKYGADRKLEISTDAGGREFVKAPPQPVEVNGKIRVRFPWGVSGLSVLPSGTVAVSWYQKLDSGDRKSWIGLYDENLELLGVEEFDGHRGIIGAGRGGVYVFCMDAGERWVERCMIVLDDSEAHGS